MTDTTPKKPVSTLRDGRIQAAIWKNPGGKQGTFHSVTFSRTYTDTAGKPQSTDSFSGVDLLKLSRIAGRAYDELAKLRSSDEEDAGEE